MGVLSQSDVTQMIWDHRIELGNLLKKSVEELGLCAVRVLFQSRFAVLLTARGVAPLRCVAVVLQLCCTLKAGLLLLLFSRPSRFCRLARCSPADVPLSMLP